MAFATGLHVGACMVGVAILLSMIAVGSIGWANVETAFIEINYGLFRFCAESGGTEICDEYSDPPEKLEASRGMAVIGMLCLIFAGIAVAVYMFLHYKDGGQVTATIALKICIGLAIAAFVFQTIANIIYGVMYEDEYPGADLRFSFFLLIISSLLGLTGASTAYKGRPQRTVPVTGTVFITHPNTQVTVISRNAAYPPASYGQPTAPPNSNQAQPQVFTAYPPPYPGSSSKGEPVVDPTLPPPPAVYQPPPS